MSEPTKPAAKETPKADAVVIDQIALRLFAERSAKLPGRGAEQIAVQSYRDAEVFLRIQAAYKAGDLVVKVEERVMADCFCPNQKKTHPHNLVSQEMGSIAAVKQINAVLVANPTLKKYDELDWDEPTTNIARDIFPGFVKAADQFATAN